MIDRTVPPDARRRQRARLLLRLAGLRGAVEAALLADGCTFAGRVERRHRGLSRLLDRISHAEGQTWAA
jgi:hypothetical protein